MNKIITLILLFLAVMGIIGGIGYTIYCGAWPIAIGIAVVGWMAYPKAKELFNKLIG